MPLSCHIVRERHFTGLTGTTAIDGPGPYTVPALNLASNTPGMLTTILVGPETQLGSPSGDYEYTALGASVSYYVNGVFYSEALSGSIYVNNAGIIDAHRVQVQFQNTGGLPVDITDIALSVTYATITVTETQVCTGVASGFDGTDPGWRGTVTQWQRPITGDLLPGVLGDRVEISDTEWEWVNRPFLIESVRRLWQGGGQGRVIRNVQVQWGVIKLPGTSAQSGAGSYLTIGVAGQGIGAKIKPG